MQNRKWKSGPVAEISGNDIKATSNRSGRNRETSQTAPLRIIEDLRLRIEDLKNKKSKIGNRK